MTHRRIHFILLILVACASNWYCTGSLKSAASKSDDLDLLVDYMVGDFSSNAQSLRDSAFFDIRLHIRPIWTADKGNHWLYVEQATATAESKPYRQRVYKVEKEGDKGFKSIVYTLPDQGSWAGKYRTPEAFDKLKPADLSLREGCTVFLKKMENNTFAGSTRDADCESNLRGAKYATSKVTITKKQLLSWDQGFNEKGEQVWGATKGGYELVKQ